MIQFSPPKNEHMPNRSKAKISIKLSLPSQQKKMVLFASYFKIPNGIVKKSSLSGDTPNKYMRNGATFGCSTK
jgi:hypothetical protein